MPSALPKPQKPMPAFAEDRSPMIPPLSQSVDTDIIIPGDARNKLRAASETRKQ